MMIIFVNADDEINKITTEDTKHDNDDDNDGLVVHGSHVLLVSACVTVSWSRDQWLESVLLHASKQL